MDVFRQRCVSRYVCCSYGVVLGVKGGGGLPVRQNSYAGHRVNLLRASDWLKNGKKKQLKVKQSRQTRVYLGFNGPKTGTMRFGPMAGLVGCAFDLILECTCFWLQTAQVYPFWPLPYNICPPEIDYSEPKWEYLSILILIRTQHGV